MKPLLTLLFFCAGLTAIAQSGKLYDEASVTTKPEFPGGEPAFAKFVESNFQNAEDFPEPTVEVKFIVETDGTLSDIKAVFLGRITPSEKEAVRVMEMSPKWTPAKKAGKTVRCIVRRSIKNPLSFDIRNEDVQVIDAEPVSREVEKIPADPLYNMDGIDVKPDFPGGMDKFDTFFQKNFKMPEGKSIKSEILVKFIVEKDGSLGFFKVISDIGPGTGQEAVRVLKLSPKWIPGEYNGKKVRVQYTKVLFIDTNKK